MGSCWRRLNYYFVYSQQHFAYPKVAALGLSNIIFNHNQAEKNKEETYFSVSLVHIHNCPIKQFTVTPSYHFNGVIVN